MIKTFLPVALSGHLLLKLPQVWPGNGRGTVQMGSTVPVSSPHLFELVKSNPYYYCYYYFHPEPWVWKLWEIFWIQISGLLINFLKVNSEYVEELKCLICLWYFWTCTRMDIYGHGQTLYENFVLSIVTRAGKQ